MRLTSSNTPVSTTTSFDLIENNQPKRSLLPSMSSSSMLGDTQSIKQPTPQQHTPQQQNQQTQDQKHQEKAINADNGRDTTAINNSVQTNGQPGYDKMVNDVIMDPLTITKVDTPPPTTSNLSAKSSPTISS